jgi:hypothetical protein
LYGFCLTIRPEWIEDLSTNPDPRLGKAHACFFTDYQRMGLSAHRTPSFESAIENHLLQLAIGAEVIATPAPIAEASTDVPGRKLMFSLRVMATYETRPW